METRKIKVQSLLRHSNSDPWMVSFVAPTDNIIRATIGTAGEATVGPRLHEVLSTMENKITNYPYSYTWVDFLGDTTNLFTARLDGEILLHLEIGVPTYHLLSSIKGDEGSHDAFVELMPLANGDSSEITISSIPQPNTNTGSTDTLSNSDWLVSGKVVEVKDGDTISYQVEKVGKKAAKDVTYIDKDGKTQTVTGIKVGDKVDVRYSALNAPETIEHGYEQGVTRNEEFCSTYHVSATQAFEIGDEAWKFNAKMLGGAGYVVLDVDSTIIKDKDGMDMEVLSKDIYGRITAAIYKTSETDGSVFFQNKKVYATNVNKTLLMARSQRVPGAPLVIPYYHFIDDVPGRLPTKDWLVETGIRKPDSAYELGDRIKEEQNQETAMEGQSMIGGPTTKPPVNGDVIHVKYTESQSNQIDFIEPDDDRMEDIYPDGNSDRVRIGDVALVIPPLAIEVNRVSSIEKIKTLRSKASLMIKAGSSATTMTLQLYFHDLDSINGSKVPMNPKYPELKRNYYLDGLRPLIAQFKKAPFLPIDNKYINETLGIDSVALVNLSIQTVPGFPHSLSATITLAKFEHEAYMPQAARLGDTINYPLLRWYYQSSLRDDLDPSQRSPYHTYLEPIPDTGLTNDFVFQLADEQDLMDRKQALRSMRYMDDPTIAKQKFTNPTDATNMAEKIFNPIGATMEDGTKNPMQSNTVDNTKLGRLYADGWAAQHVLDYYNKFMELKNAGKIPTKRADDGTMAFDEYISKTHCNQEPWVSLWKQIYGDKKDEDVADVSHFAPYEAAWLYDQDYTEMIKEDSGGSGVFGGTIKIRLYESSNVKLFPKEYTAQAKKDGDFTIIYLPDTEIQTLNRIVKNGEDAEKQYVEGIKKYKDLQALVNETEANLALFDYDIPGLLCTGVHMMYENQFSNAQLEELDGPTFQFLGGQDPYIQVEFEADDEALKAFKLLIEETERYSREYRTGITSGFLGTKNHLMQLFGIKTVMVENIQIRTVPGFPGRYQISMTMCGFDKTQKHLEQLEGLSPMYTTGEIDRSSIEASKYNPAIDEAIIERKMKFLEVYPDLELPTYEELNADLKYISSEISLYPNRTGGIYVDPDFYIATPVTMREMIREKSKTETTMSLKDLTGIEMTTSSTSPNALDGDQSMWDLLNSVDSRGAKIDPVFSWSGNVDDKDAGTSNHGKNGITFVNEDVKKYVSDRKGLKTPPTYDEWVSWGMGKTKRGYDSWVKNQDANPPEWKVYKKIYQWIDQFFVTRGYVYNDKNKDTTDSAWQQLTYTTQEDLYGVSYNYLASTHPKYLTKKDKDTVNTKLDLKTYRNFGGHITRERLANLVKAIIHARSKWKQLYATGMPMVDADGNAAGIMGIPLSSEAPDVATAKRLLWDWNYNMEWGLNQLFEGYQFSLDAKDIEHKAAPWDWMISAYATGSIKGEMLNPFWTQVYSIFNAYYNRYDLMYATPTETTSYDIMQQHGGLSAHQMGIIKGNKSDLITDLLNVGYRKDDKTGKADTEKWLNAKTEAEVQKIYADTMKDLLDRSSVDKQANANVDRSDGGAAAAASSAIMASNNDSSNAKKYSSEAANYQAYVQTQKFMKDAEANRLVHQKNPQDIFPYLFTDMIQYDQRFRLLRAFPTFQMFIVDEGKWMTNYKLWDNLYGFNAIQSIDIHKSRKIAADTAIIEMTNIYSNLTSRAMDTAYGEWDYKFWDNLVWGNPNQEILDARKELLSAMYLETGARIHLRIGYGSSAPDLPVAFNGIITEMNNDEVVQIIAQGDGLELTNVISGDPKDDNSHLFIVEEPRDLICTLLTSKGNWFKDVLNYSTKNELFRDNPLGIMHFGLPGTVPPGNVFWFNKNYGEAAQNIYSSNGLNTFSQWTYQDGSDIPWTFDGPIWKWPHPGDEANIVLNLYNSTTWDVAQTIAYCSPDYIAAVHPFELRSTLFFGKPYWEFAYQYDSRYEYDAKSKAWTRYKDLEHRKPYMQAHILDGSMDIISNKLKASTDGVYTNVIVNYDGHQTPIIMADWDIRFDKQTTTVIDAQIVHHASNGPNFFTAEKQAIYYGASAVRDYIKDMYKGEIVILGDPTIKPYDLCYMKDTMNDMQGNIFVKSVTHHFSHDTGFVTSIEPDAVVVNDDKALLQMGHWMWSFGTLLCSAVIGKKVAAKAIKRMIPSSWQAKAIKYGKKGGEKYTHFAINNAAKLLKGSDPEVQQFKKLMEQYLKLDDGPEKEKVYQAMKDLSVKFSQKVKDWKAAGDFAGKKLKGKAAYLVSKKAAVTIEEGVKALKGGVSSFKTIGRIGTIFVETDPIAWVATAILDTAFEGIAEWWRRKKAVLQAVLMIPIQYQGRQYTAGINGHKGMVIGDAPGKLDSFYSGMGFDGKNGNSWGEYIIDTMNWLTESNSKDYSVTEEDLMSQVNKDNQ